VVDWGGKVAAWLGGVAGVSATLAGLIVATAKQPLPGWIRALFVVLVIIAAVSFVALLLTGVPVAWRWWRHRRSGEQKANLAPLVVRLKEPPLWENYKYIALIGAFHVEITNTTDRPIRIASYAFTSDNRGLRSWEFDATGEEHLAVRRETWARQEDHRYGPALRIHGEVPAHQSVSGWFVTAVTRDPMGGTPACTIIVKDDLGNECQVTVERQEPQKVKISIFHD
jgi:hypothetical protein